MVDLAHEGVRLEQVLAIDEEVEGVILWEVDTLADDEVELVRAEVLRDQEPDDY